MSKLRGTKEIKVGGKMRPIKFGTAQTSIFCELMGDISYAEAQTILSKERIEKQDIKPSTMLKLYYSAFQSGALSAGKEIDFQLHEIGDWMDESPEAFTELQKTAADAVDPNGTASEK